MTEDSPKAGSPDTPGRKPSRLRIPGFVNDQDVGLGDVVKRVTSMAGVKTCRGCEGRAATLNRWVTFSGRNSPGR
ncbi:hypothetical protein ACFT9M_16615 [Micromonospora purpureochromogenes]|uniref:hypothetical protein n=1 Tax=Micromonospora purpureochromogenes TaxID=47872 RepID=UPI00362B3A3D